MCIFYFLSVNHSVKNSYRRFVNIFISYRCIIIILLLLLLIIRRHVVRLILLTFCESLLFKRSESVSRTDGGGIHSLNAFYPFHDLLHTGLLIMIF